MGEVVISGGGMEFNWDAEAENVTGTVAAAARAGGKDSIVSWEGFLPKMMLRVLLVEADDSTRQIITALLRKCTYQVAAVSDGLKAWEVLKRKPQNIDLILTEVDLPSISGFALLTLIMEHRICKNIPVIMMSSQDSVSTVYKCMLRGAADFLVKPVRKNELRNLWQHVWRRQASSNSGLGMPDESVLQQKVEATAENHNMSKHSSDDMACIKRSREGTEKESDDQSSCTKPELEVERAELDCVPDLPYSKRSKTSSTESVPTIIGHNYLTKEVQDYHVGAEGSSVTAGIDTNRNFQEDTELHGDWRCFDATSQACGDSHALTHSSREAIDLIGAFDNNLKCINRSSSSYAGINNFDSLPSLDLSLKRSLPCGLMNKVMEERGSLNHSDASAFSRYVNKTPLPGHSTSPIACNQLDNQEANLSKSFSLHTVNSNADPPGLAIVSPSSTPLAFGQLGETENRSLPALIPVKGLGFQNTSNASGSLIPPAFYTPSGMSQMQSSGSVSHQEGSFQVSCNPASQNADDANDPSENKEKLRLESPGEPCHVSSATDQTANSGFCNETPTNLHSLGPGSNGRLEPLPESFRVHDGTSLKSIQREAALTKFRLKRKERCFEKKVRYESRKKLAEKRPRVKGQFVCRLSNEPAPAKSSVV